MALNPWYKWVFAIGLAWYSRARIYIYFFEVVFYIKGIGHQARVSSQYFVENSVISRLYVTFCSGEIGVFFRRFGLILSSQHFVKNSVIPRSIVNFRSGRYQNYISSQPFVKNSVIPRLRVNFHSGRYIFDISSQHFAKNSVTPRSRVGFRSGEIL